MCGGLLSSVRCQSRSVRLPAGTSAGFDGRSDAAGCMSPGKRALGTFFGTVGAGGGGPASYSCSGQGLGWAWSAMGTSQAGDCAAGCHRGLYAGGGVCLYGCAQTHVGPASLGGIGSKGPVALVGAVPVRLCRISRGVVLQGIRSEQQSVSAEDHCGNGCFDGRTCKCCVVGRGFCSLPCIGLGKSGLGPHILSRIGLRVACACQAAIGPPRIG